jgi:hypothetical protein
MQIQNRWKIKFQFLSFSWSFWPAWKLQVVDAQQRTFWLAEKRMLCKVGQFT